MMNFLTLFRKFYVKSEKKERKESLQIDPRDVFLVSYPRSGNTWMRYLLANLLYPEVDWSIDNLSQVVPDIHEKIPESLIQTDPRIIKSHSPYQANYLKVVYMYRDGRDVAVSFYDRMSKLRGYKGDLGDFVLEMLQGRLKFGSWQDHVSSWLFQDLSISLLPIAYENLKKQPRDELRRIGLFLGFEWSDSALDYAISMSTLEKHKGYLLRYKRHSHWDRRYRGGLGGIPGDWRKVFNYSLNELFLKYAGSALEKLGYPKE